MDKELIKEELRKELARREYSEYCKYVHKGNWILGKHLKLICDEIENLIYRKMKENVLIISTPPQHGKSQCITETLPSYYLGKFPNKRVVALSYADDLARKFGRRNRTKIKEYGKSLFGIDLAKEQDSEFEISGNIGSMLSTGIMGGITGNPADFIIIDDPIKNRQEAESETYRNRLWEEYLDSVNTRLSANGIVIIVMTRWHEDDLVGRVVSAIPEQCKVINIPLEAEDNDLLGRKLGDALFPEIGKDNEWLKRYKKLYTTTEGVRSWNALMQGSPSAQEGNLIKRKYFKKYSLMPEKFDQVLQSWDCTFKDSDGSDYVVGQVWGRKGPNKYLLDMVRARMDFSTTINQIISMTMKWPQAYMKLIEDKANGSAIIQVLSQKIEGIMPITPKESKLARVQSVLPQLESGNVYLPEGAAWLEDFIDECAKFPNGKHDDMVDGMSQALSKMINDYSIEEIKVKDLLPFALQTDQEYDGGYIEW